MRSLSDEAMHEIAHELHRRFRKNKQHSWSWDDMHVLSQRFWMKQAEQIVDLVLAADACAVSVASEVSR